MAPARKKKRVQVVENESAVERKSFNVDAPISILKDTVPNLPSVKPMPQTDEMDVLNLRRKTYFIHGADKLEENEPSIINNTKEQLSLNSDEKIRRLTYVVKSFLHEDTERHLVNDRPGIEMAHSELEIKGIQMQESDVEQKTILQEPKPKKRGRKKKNEVSAMSLHKDSESMVDTQNEDGKKDIEGFVAQAAGSKKPTKHSQKKKSANTELPVKTIELENNVERDNLHELASPVKAKGRKKKIEKAQAEVEENKTDPTPSDPQKKSIKRGRKKNTKM
ncbi:uncharacterized protein LOC142140289 [Mixophyes fleayi]|uniref:uncharacterized protein LOC142140289 n=1 Tax=Mixophyes fleayi TaxID=3061075 RepID=UPI003F4E20F9